MRAKGVRAKAPLVGTLREPICYFFPYPVRNLDHKRITHAESALSVSHTRICPALGEHLNHIELVGNKTTNAPLLFRQAFIAIDHDWLT